MKKPFLIVSIALLLAGCANIPNDLMRPCAETLKMREAQSRTFHVNSDKELLRASVSVLQDMGYTIKESCTEYGVLTASKEASAVSTGQVIGAVAIVLLCGDAPPIDKTQYITVTMVILDKCEDGSAMARTTFQRVVVRTDNSYYTQVITDQNVYQEFYEKLDKALFLEVNRI